ncbi:MAG: alginate export family protein [Deltaproteobacteria bacterium]|nr:MAG: alginate export family protein [Deltaproteobacteria bacterium]
MKKSMAIICSLILVIFFSVSSFASDELGETEEWELGDVTVGGDIRIQGIATKNVTDLEDDIYKPQEVDLDNSEFLRHRTRVWLDVDLWDDARAYIRLAAEPTWGIPDESLSIEHLIVIDNSYIQLSELFGTPVSVRFGRQDLAYGEGFLVKEGTPADESRTSYFDAIKISADLGYSTTGDIFAAKINENWKQDVYYGVSRDDEDLYGIYLTNKYLKDHHAELYGLHREHLHMNTTAIGLRVSGKIIAPLSYGAEYAQQFGKYNGRLTLSDFVEQDADRNAWGWYGHASYQPDLPFKPLFKLGCYMTSGDDRGTSDTYEQWDSFYSEWPKYSELYLYTNQDHFSYEGLDTEEGAWGNMLILEAKASVEPIEDLTVTLKECIFRANEENGPGDGSNRGNNPQLLIGYKLTDNVSTSLLGEYFLPGDYYAEEADNAYLTQFQLYARF